MSDAAGAASRARCTRRCAVCARRRRSANAAPRSPRCGGARRLGALHARALATRRGGRARRHARRANAFPTLDMPYPQPLAAFRGRRHRPQGRARRAARRPQRRPRWRVRASTSPLISVLLDAGAGSRWRYRERESGQTLRPLRRTGRGELPRLHGRALLVGRWAIRCGSMPQALAALDARALAEVFQVSLDNPLVGLEGRAALLHRLGDALRAQPQVYTALGQPGHLFDALTHHRHAPELHHHHPNAAVTHHQVAAARVLGVAARYASAASGRAASRCSGMPLGDVWPHPARRRRRARAPAGCRFTSCLSGSPIRCSSRSNGPACRCTELDALTGLPEYRNGGLLLDAGVIVPRDAATSRSKRSSRATPGSSSGAR